jgi:surface polysaccharide O-acyltransferase-like enzyme
MERRSAGGYVKERVTKLLIPMIFGLLLIVPIQPFMAGNFWNGSAGYFDSFTKVTDLSGYDGAFSVGQFWFLLFLFGIAMITLPFLLMYKKKGKGTFGGGVPFIVIVLAGLLPLVGRMIFDISGKSPLEFLAYFLLGYFFLTSETVLEKLEKYRFLLLGLFALGAAFFMYLFAVPLPEDSWLMLPIFGYIGAALYQLVSWLAVLMLVGLARRYINFSGKTTNYLVKSSFGVYLFHQSWIVVLGYFAIKLIGSPGAQYPLILLSAIIMTFLTYEIVRRIPGVRWIFGLKK